MLGVIGAGLLGALVPVADQQRAHPVRAPSLAGRPAADHELLAAPDAGLDPLAGALARPVGALQALGDDALEPLPAGGLEQVGAAVGAVGRGAPARALEAELEQELPALLVGQ